MSKHITLDNLNAVLPPLKHMIDKKSENIDWNENDPNASGHIKHRPFYREEARLSFVSNMELIFSSIEPLSNPFKMKQIIEGQTYHIKWDNSEYECVAYIADGPNSPSIGNGAIIDASGGNNEPFFITIVGNMLLVFAQEIGTHIISIDSIETVVHKIPSEYLPDIVGAKGTGIDAEVFNGSIFNSATGNYSHSEGSNTTASGNGSHAEGGGTIASGNSSHAEGYGTMAPGECAHAEGFDTDASGNSSHAEGYRTEASGYNSHAEGYATKAYGDYSHVQGKYNITDYTNTYAHIVGNGTSDTNRSNAHTLDWDGNAWFQGEVYVGGTGQDDANAKVLATQEYVQNSIEGIGIGVDNAVLYTEQSLTDEQKTQARANIGAVKSWNDLTDRPFGEMYGDTLTWDVNTEGKLCVDLDGALMCKVSDVAPVMSDLVNGFTLYQTVSGVDYAVDITSADVIDSGAGVVLDNAIRVIFVSAEGVGVDSGGGVIFSEPGTYLLYTDGFYVSSLTIPGYTGFPSVKKIDKKYLPNDGTVRYDEAQTLTNEQKVQARSNIESASTTDFETLYDYILDIGAQTIANKRKVVGNRILIKYADRFTGMSIYGRTVQVDGGLEAFGQSRGEIILRIKGKNLLEIPYKTNSHTNSALGLTFTVNSDYSVSITGTNITNDTVYYNLADTNNMISRKYIGVDATDIGASDDGFAMKGIYVQNLYGINNKFIAFVGIPAGQTINKTYYPQLEFGSAATEFESPIEAQVFAYSTPNGLRGVPTTSASNHTYIDSASQYWIADEVNLKRGIFIQRIGQIDSYAGETISTPWLSSTGELSTGAVVQYVLDVPIETEISDSIMEQYQTLHPNDGYTSVYVMDGFEYGYQSVEYIANDGTTGGSTSGSGATGGGVTIDDVIEEVEKAVSFNSELFGLPVLKLAGDTTGMTKDNAVTLAYYYSGTTGNCTVKWQGSSSLSWEKKNYTIKFDKAFEASEGWGAQSKYCFKANFIDHSHARNIVSAKLWGQIVKTRTPANETLNALPNGGAIDGFPCVIILNDKFHGLYTWNIPKDGWMFGMSNPTLQQAIVCADGYSSGTTFTGAATLDGDFDLEYVANEDSSDWVLTSLNRLISAVSNSNGSDLDTTVAQYLDWDSAIDYYILTVMLGGSDMIDKNYLLSTYDGVKWFFSAYDMDTTYGLQWHGKSFVGATGRVTFADMAGGNKVMHLIKTYKKDKLKARYAELRSSVLSEDNVYLEFSNFAASISRALLEEDVRKWPTIPSSSVGNISQILNWYRMRVAAMDKNIDEI